MVLSANLGFPRIGPKRELKKAVENYWKGESNAEELINISAEIRRQNWEMQKASGIDLIPSNDFSLYDHILDMIALLGCVPERYNFAYGNVDMKTYFAMARGAQSDGLDVKAMEMTKWFDTNYHYIVPEFTKNQEFALASTKIFDEYEEARRLGIETKPVLTGPITFLKLGKMKDDAADALSLAHKLIPIYEEIFGKLSQLGASWIQIDEPYLSMDLDDEAKDAYKMVYEELGSAAKDLGLNLFLATYFEGLGTNLDLALSLPIHTLHIDLKRGLSDFEAVLNAVPESLTLSLGLVDGRNIWINDFEASKALIEKATSVLGKDRIIIAPSCSLLHSPVDLQSEEKLDDELKSWLAFATQKIEEVVVLTSVAKGEMPAQFEANKQAIASRNASPRVHNAKVQERVEAVTDAMKHRNSAFDARAKVQSQEIELPLLPITTIGSFPQTPEVREYRAKFRNGEITQAEYDAFIEEETTRCIRIQEEMDIDVLVHGEFERNDMVEYFGEKLNGFAFSQFGWVQSYGSRCVKPPIIFGDVSRPHAMTVDWAEFSQNQTERYMKGMLTGPVT
ncbi:MAG: 5-methyltetrahydropteroyltriglutamate--homocysteine S-methyltransferase, partial [Rickettsiales bacterium]|nr:5-methyltetrahydropteroyltriglutamate--homocysteine S-methyltransferase [Rickettsiales bacterium]